MQVRVQTDLCQRLITQSLEQRLGDALLAQGKDWVKIGMKVLDALNGKPGQPWYKKIKMPGGDPRSTTFVSQNGFLTSLRPILTSEPYRSMTLEDLVTLLVRYWTAVRKVLPDCFVEGEQKKYIVQKSAGVAALHALFPTIVEMARRRGTRITEEALEELLAEVLEDGPGYWLGKNDSGAAAFGSSNKGIRILVSHLNSKLTERAPVILV
jgi:hypothetical protein